MFWPCRQSRLFVSGGRGGKEQGKQIIIVAKSPCIRNAVNDVDLKGTSEPPSWHIPSGLSPHPLFPFPCLVVQGLLSLPMPNMYGTTGVVAGGGRRRRWGAPRFLVYYSSAGVFSFFSEPCNFQRVPRVSPWGRITSQRQVNSPGSLTCFRKETVQTV